MELTISNIASIISILGTLVTIFVVVFNGGKLYNRIEQLEKNSDKTNERINKIDERIDKIDERINKLTESFAILSYRVEQFEKKMEMVLQKLDALPSMISRITVLENDNEQNKTDIKQLKMIVDSYSNRHSPRTLNELGQKMFDQMNGEEFIQHNKQQLFNAIDAEQPLTALDVEQASVTVLLKLSKNPVLNKIKDFVYTCPLQKGTDIEGNPKTLDMTLQDACFILSLPLRDEYLKLHPELDVKQ